MESGQEGGGSICLQSTGMISIALASTVLVVSPASSHPVLKVTNGNNVRTLLR
jgi:hypothetical protein